MSWVRRPSAWAPSSSEDQMLPEIRRRSPPRSSPTFVKFASSSAVRGLDSPRGKENLQRAVDGDRSRIRPNGFALQRLGCNRRQVRLRNPEIPQALREPEASDEFRGRLADVFPESCVSGPGDTNK